LNFLAFRAAFSAAGSPLTSLSAPMFLPFDGHPYLGLNKLQETIMVKKQINVTVVKRFLIIK
jgi:hypothetical protein